jgi:hypothetical protein
MKVTKMARGTEKYLLDATYFFRSIQYMFIFYSNLDASDNLYYTNLYFDPGTMHISTVKSLKNSIMISY